MRHNGAPRLHSLLSERRWRVSLGRTCLSPGGPPGLPSRHLGIRTRSRRRVAAVSYHRNVAG